MVAPGAGDFVQQRLEAVAILGDVEHGEIVHHAAPHETAIGGGERDELAHRDGGSGSHEAQIAAVGAIERYDGLGERDGTGKGEGEVAEFGDH